MGSLAIVFTLQLLPVSRGRGPTTFRDGEYLGSLSYEGVVGSRFLRSRGLGGKKEYIKSAPSF